ncbi:MAG: acyl-CoA reductase [Chitinophagales bacterium]
MDLEHRISLLLELGKMMKSEPALWKEAKKRAFAHNPWLVPEFIDFAVKQIVDRYLQKDLLEQWVQSYQFPMQNPGPKTIGLVMAGNIPLVGFHDFLSIFISGHRQLIKLSSKDQELMGALLTFLYEKEPETKDLIQTASLLKGCNGYIATGSNNTARYFDYYFKKYPSLIRRNRTAVAILSGSESKADLENLADDVYLYFGLGCRNVTKLFVPENYDFVPLLSAFGKYRELADHHKYKNNYDYQLSLAILNKRFYMSNDSILLLEAESPFSSISVLHYAYYINRDQVIPLPEPENIQCVTGNGFIPFGMSQQPALTDYADGADTLLFLRDI